MKDSISLFINSFFAVVSDKYVGIIGKKNKFAQLGSSAYVIDIDDK